VTTHASLHHHPFFYVPAYDDSGQRLFFVSHRTGAAQIFAEERGRGELVQLTNCDGLDEWSLHPSHGGEHVYFTVGASLRRVHVETFAEEELVNLGPETTQEAGTVGGAVGTTALSYDDRWWAVTIQVGDVARLVVLDTTSGRHEVVLECPTMFHPQFHPDDADLLRYASSHDQRLWVVERDGSDNRLAYARDVQKSEWITHETWLPGRRELIAVNWPHGVIGVDVDSGKCRRVAAFNAWHPSPNAAGTLMVTDTNHPDIGLHLFDPCDGVGVPRFLCHAGASNVGSHWHTDHCAYDDGPVSVYAPQHTHPHPHFSPDNRHVAFTSDRTGVAQVYEVELTAEVLGERLASLAWGEKWGSVDPPAPGSRRIASGPNESH
jgi:oligogalacturonide lyase